MENKNENNKIIPPNPKHRHDGTSPLPLGMDWSPPPKEWDGRYTVWPHDPCTGWSYCVMIPSWIVQPGSGAFGDSSLNTTVFFRVHVGIQSPEGISTSHIILRRFTDFLRLFTAVKREFHRKIIPSAPPKNSLSKVNSNRLLLEERRCALDEWIGKLLSDIDLSRSALIATFLELEAAVRSCASVAELTGSSMLLSTPSEFVGTDGTSSNLQDKSEELLRSELQHGKVNIVIEGDKFHGTSSKVSFLSGDHVDLTAELKQDKFFHHVRNLSTESITSDTSSDRGSELSNPSVSNSLGDGSVDQLHGGEAPMGACGSMKTHMNDVLVIHPAGQQHKLNKFLSTMNRKLVAAKTDMDDLIARLNQEITVKEYLTAKVKDIEAELVLSKLKAKEDLQQAILLERERVTQIQWEIDELRRNYLDMESMLKFGRNEKARADLESARFGGEKELLLQELDMKIDQVKDLQKHFEELELKSKSDIRVLVKEVKFLRSSQAELKEVLNQSLKEKTELERILQKEKKRKRRITLARKKLIDACEDLRHRLQESSVNFLAEGDDKFTVNHSSLSDALGLLTTSDTRIGILLAKAQLLGQDDAHHIKDIHEIESSESVPTDMLTALNITDDPGMVSDVEMASDGELKKMFSDTITDNVTLRKQINAVVRCALKNIVKPLKADSGEAPPRKTVLKWFLRR